MHTKDLVVDDHTQRQEVKHVCKVVPYVGVAVFPGTFRIETVRLRHAAGFVVTSNQMNSVGVSQFQTDEEGNRFNAEHAAVDIITCEVLDLSVFNIRRLSVRYPPRNR